MEQVRTYIKKRVSNGYDKEFVEYLRSHFQKKMVPQRYEAFIDIFPEMFTRGRLVELTQEEEPDTPPPPRADGAPSPAPYEEKGWRDVGVTSELAAEVCILTGHPVLVLHNTTLIYERYPEGWDKDHKKPIMCFNL